jgi:hypothetical protein
MACHRCEELQKELSKTKANFKSLNKKIIPTDLLVKKYKETRMGEIVNLVISGVNVPWFDKL